MSNSTRPLRPGDPSEVDGYRLVGRLGRGGMGTVYLAEAPSGLRVALKLIHPDLAEDEAFRRRFAREVAAARRVARFSTAAVIDARLEGEDLYIASEYVPGPTLSEAVRADGPMRDGTLESLALGVAAALTAVHRSGIVHRDLKPSNVLLSPVGPKVIDFGIARALDEAGEGITRTNQLIGTPSYMAPELIAGRPPVPAGDVFAWGCLVAFAGTGSAPFDAATVPEVLHNVSNRPPRLDGLDPNLYDLVASALDKDPENRPTSQELLDRLVGWANPEEADIARTITDSWTDGTGRRTEGPPEVPGPPWDPQGQREQQAREPDAPPGVRPDPHPQGPSGPGGPQADPRGPHDVIPMPPPPPWRRPVLIGAAVAATLVLVAATALVLSDLSDRDAPPGDTATVFEYDFEENPEWPDLGLHHPENSNEIGYWAAENGVMLVRDPAAHDYQETSAYAPPLEAEAPPRLIARTDARVVMGYGQAQYGLACWERFGPQHAPVHSTTYRAVVNFDGERARIQQWSHEAQTWEDIANEPASEVHEPFPALQGEDDPEVTNGLAFACEYVAEGEDGSPAVELSAWVNDELVAHAVNEEVPDETAEPGVQAVRQFGVALDGGPVDQHVGVLFENFLLEEILPD